jgi:two-component system CheB/CheR fusion protein
VLIGASAGGLEAVTMLLQNLPSHTGIAYIYIQHQEATHKSMLTTILERATKMKVFEARDLLSVEADHFYVLPPNKNVSISNGRFVLSKLKAKNFPPSSIDHFFIDTAEKLKQAVIGILLSGNGTDGTLGLKAIRASGGLTFAQDNSAKFDGMPKAAVAEDAVDLVLSPLEMARELERIGRQGTILHTELVEGDEKENEGQDENLENILQLLKKSTGVDFRHYKLSTIRRRIIRRMLLHKLETLKQYNTYLQKHAGEINKLYQDLLINVTSFFRDPDTCEYLRKTLFPGMLKRKSSDDSLRIWVPACSTGEEAYSLAMIIHEIMGEKASDSSVQIFATDLSELAIAKARLGMYTEADVANISAARLKRFFIKMESGYRIIKPVRDLCVFATHNIFKDPPFSRLDLISCCNLMIYLDNPLQKRIIATFHYALNTNGYLILGKSETVSSSPQHFSQPDKKYKIYSRKKEGKSPLLFEMNLKPSRTKGIERVPLRKIIHKQIVSDVDIDKIVDHVLLTGYTPPSVVVNSDLEILQFRGSTGLFLEPSPGKASLNLLKMARAGLPFELRNAVHKATRLGHIIKRSGIEIKYKGEARLVSLEVVPLKSNDGDKLFLVIFNEEAVPVKSEVRKTFAKDKLVKKLQEELQTAKEDMRSIIEEQEASNEELQSANEEIVSSNEELQSINEELETSKEELESTNEELTTINSELQVRNEQLAESYDYAESVFGTIREAVLVLDKNLRVKLANASFYKMFRTNEEETEGIYIYDLCQGAWNYPDVRKLLEDLVPRNIQYNGFPIKHTFPAIGEKHLLLNAHRIVQKIHKQELILLAIEDITEHEIGKHIIAEREEWLQNIANNVPVMIWVANTNKVCTFLNKTWLEYTGRTLKKENDWIADIHPDDVESYLKTFHFSFNERKPFKVGYRLRKENGDYRWIMDIGRPTFSPNGEFTGYLGSCTEIHDEKMAQEQLEQKVIQRTHDLTEANVNLRNINSELEQFAYVASHDLQEPLRKIMTFADRLQLFKNELPEDGKIYLGKIYDSSKRMSRLIDDLLNFSRASSLKTNFVKTDLNKIVKEVLIDFEVLLIQKNGKVNLDALPVVNGIPIQLTQLFHNLISNAFKFAKDNEPIVINITSQPLSKKELEAHSQLDKEEHYVKIVLSDNGIGFEQEFAEQIFVIFQRIHNRRFQGTGIGLALCRKIVNNHKGIIYADSEEGKGASFTVILSLSH